jgi:phosphopentomutase
MTHVIFIILDGVGVGALPDAQRYGDEGSDTLGNVSRTVSLRLPCLQSLGLGNITPLVGVGPARRPLGLVGRLASRSAGKDSTVGHWEHMGLVTTEPFPTYPKGFPDEVIRAFEKEIGRELLGNRAASGTEIISELGEHHVASGKPIVYTSADSVFQIAAHVDVVPPEQLACWCETARQLLQGEHAVARVIARPFAGATGAFFRTPDRRDYSLAPPGPTYLDAIRDRGLPVIALGKIGDIFAGRGITKNIKAGSNDENLSLLWEFVTGTQDGEELAEGLLITNLADFDTAWGHRNDVEGFARGLESFDAALEPIVKALRPNDRLLISADHGVDPTTPSTDHSREYAPLLVYPPPENARAGIYEGEFADTGASAFEYLTGRRAELEGRSVCRLQPRRGWSRYAAFRPDSAGTVCGLPGAIGAEEAKAAGRWLVQKVGPAPEIGIVLGSGLDLATEGEPETRVLYRAVPYWRVGDVPGHPYVLVVAELGGRRCAVLQGRIHEYEGFDLSEVQLPVRSLSAWGVQKLVLTSAGGAVRQGLETGTILAAKSVLDFQYRAADGRPVSLKATEESLALALKASCGGGGHVQCGIHASVPGPQYETPGELEALRARGAATVSMTPAGELRAAIEEGLEVAVLTVVTNTGDTTHAEVLAASDIAARGLTRVVTALVEEWG